MSERKEIVKQIRKNMDDMRNYIIRIHDMNKIEKRMYWFFLGVTILFLGLVIYGIYNLTIGEGDITFTIINMGLLVINSILVGRFLRDVEESKKSMGRYKDMLKDAEEYVNQIELSTTDSEIDNHWIKRFSKEDNE